MSEIARERPDHRWPLRLLPAAVALAVLLTPWAIPASGATAPTRPRAQQPRALPPLPPEVRARKRWLIGVKCDTPPFGYLNARGEKAGFEVDVARRFAAIAFGDGNRVDLVCVSVPQREPTLNARTVDMVLATFTWTQDRATRLDFSLPYYANGGRLAVLKTSTVETIGELAGKTIVTTRGSIYDRWAPNCLRTSQLLAVDSTPAMLTALREGRAQAIAFDEVFMLGLVATNPDIRLIQDSFLQFPFGIAVRKGDVSMLRWVNAAIQLMTRRDEFFPLLRRNVPPVAVGDVPRPGRPALKYPAGADPLTNCTIIRLPPRPTAAAPPRTPPPSGRGTAKASARPLKRCPVCGFEATFVFSTLPARGSTVKAVWYYNRRKMGEVGKARAKTVTSFIRWAGPAPRGFYWCDLVVRPPGKQAATVARAVIRRR